MNLEANDLLTALLVSGCLGALIGMERQWESQHSQHDSLFGVRTFTLWSVMGTISAYLTQHHLPHFFIASFLVVTLGLITRHVVLLHRGESASGLTTLTAALLTLLIGGMVFWGQKKVSVILTVSIILLLAGKRNIHHWTSRFTEQDVHAALQFAAVTGVVLPLAPNEMIHWHGLAIANPFMVWLMVVLVAGLGFFGYVAIRLLGTRGGLGAIGLLGGLASSTATTLTYSRQSRERPELSDGFMLAVVLACTVMLFRVLVLVMSMNQDLFERLWVPLGWMSFPGLVYAVWFWLWGRKHQPKEDSPSVPNPLGLKVALQFAALYAVIVCLTRFAAERYGNAGIHGVSFISGLADMDAIVLSLCQTVSDHKVDPHTGAIAIILAATSNTILKWGLVWFLAAPAARRRIWLVFLPTALIGFGIWLWK